MGEPVRRRTRIAPGALAAWASAVPFIVMTGLLLGGAAVWLGVASVQSRAGGYTTEAWATAFDNPRNVDSIVNSLIISAVIATIAVLVGTPLALAIATASRGRDVSVAIANAAANFGGASLAVAWIATLGTFGFVRLTVSSVFGWSIPVELSSLSGYVVVYCSFVVPLYVLLMLPGAGVLRAQFWEAAQCCGASRLRYWRRVGLPVLAPFMVSGWVLSFTWAAGQYSVPFALVGETPAESLITLRIGELLFSAIGGSLRFQQAAVYSVLLVAVSLVALVCYQLGTRRVLRWVET